MVLVAKVCHPGAWDGGHEEGEAAFLMEWRWNLRREGR